MFGEKVQAKVRQKKETLLFASAPAQISKNEGRKEGFQMSEKSTLAYPFTLSTMALNVAGWFSAKSANALRLRVISF